VETIGDRLKFLRNQKGLKSQDMAKQIGFSQSTISLWENDKRNLLADNIILLANFFDVSSDYILGLKEF